MRINQRDMTKNLKAPYGRVDMEVMKLKVISPKQKLVYAIMAAKQGESKFALLNNQMIADALGISVRHVSSTLKKLEHDLGIIKKLKNGQFKLKRKSRQYGMIELDMLITQNLSIHAKYLYLIYCVAANKYDANIWSRESLCSQFHMGNNSYYSAHKELIEKEILTPIKRASGSGKQTSNINYIIRAGKFPTKIPDSWLPKSAFNLDEWCEAELEKELSVHEKRNCGDNHNGTEEMFEDEPGRQRTVTSNNNLLTYAEDLNSTNTNGNFPTKISFVDGKNEQDNKLNFEEVDKLMNKPCFNINEAEEIIDIIKKSDVKMDFYFDRINEKILDWSFYGFELFCAELESRDVDTSGYALNVRDIQTFSEWNRNVPCAKDEIPDHVHRVVELGFDKVKKPYIGFSYVFSGRHPDLKSIIR